MQKRFKQIDLRVLEVSGFFIENKSTVRETAKVFGISKSTVHKDITERLKLFYPSLFEPVNAILELNKEERSIRGGNATKKKYLSLCEK